MRLEVGREEIISVRPTKDGKWEVVTATKSEDAEWMSMWSEWWVLNGIRLSKENPDWWIEDPLVRKARPKKGNYDH